MIYFLCTAHFLFVIIQKKIATKIKYIDYIPLSE